MLTPKTLTKHTSHDHPDIALAQEAHYDSIIRICDATLDHRLVHLDTDDLNVGGNAPTAA